MKTYPSLLFLLSKNMMRALLVFVMFLALSWHIHDVYAATVNKANVNDSLSKGLVGYWTFDGKDMTKTTALDTSGQGNTGTLTGRPQTAIGRIGQGLSFDNADDVVNAGTANSIDNLFLGGGSISAWIYPKSFGENGKGRIAHKASNNNPDDGYLFYISNNETNIPSLVLISAFDGASDGAWYTPAGSITLNQWQHIVVVYNDSSAANDPVFYINGVRVAVTEFSTPGGNRISDAAQNFLIGNSAGGDRTFDGIIDDVRIYNRMLKADEIKRLYTMGAATKINTAPTNNSLATGLVGYWTFDGKDMTRTTALDKSGNGNTGTLTNRLQSAIGRIGQALTFDGVNDYVDMGDQANLFFPTTFSLSAWVKRTGAIPAGNGNYVIADYNSAGNSSSFALKIGGGTNGTLHTFDFFWENPSGTFPWAESTTVTVLNTWYHVVGTWDGGTRRLYVNGIQEAADSTSQARSDVGANTAIGRPGSFDGSYFPGSIDDVRIYNRALKADEIKRLYTIGAATKINTAPTNNTLAKGLVGYWTFDGKDMTRTTALDISGQGNTGTLTNRPQTAIGRIGQALTFDGVNDYVDLGGGSSMYNNDVKTISAWIKASGYGTDGFGVMIAMDQQAGSTQGWVFYIEGNGNNRLAYNHNFSGSVGTWGTSTNSINLNTWYHVLVTYDRRSPDYNPRLYLNGVSQTVTTVTPASSTAIDESGIARVEIGSFNAATSDFFNGIIDDVRFYNRILSVDEIKRLYNMGR